MGDAAHGTGAGPARALVAVPASAGAVRLFSRDPAAPCDRGNAALSRRIILRNQKDQKCVKNSPRVDPLTQPDVPRSFEGEGGAMPSPVEDAKTRDMQMVSLSSREAAS
jgi:hypothetical protein